MSQVYANLLPLYKHPVAWKAGLTHGERSLFELSKFLVKYKRTEIPAQINKILINQTKFLVNRNRILRSHFIKPLDNSIKPFLFFFLCKFARCKIGYYDFPLIGICFSLPPDDDINSYRFAIKWHAI